ncbi:MAG: hypothetical protein IJ939_01330, partial [Clostridia bacterium]|nr:hypothetical protein [Clostridia bacterium]
MNTNPSKQETDFIRQSLADFNDKHVGNDGHEPLNIIEQDADGNIVGGILGGTYWGWMYIDILWVREDCRRQGGAPPMRSVLSRFLTSVFFQRPFFAGTSIKHHLSSIMMIVFYGQGGCLPHWNIHHPHPINSRNTEVS